MPATESERAKVSSFLKRVSLEDFSHTIETDHVTLATGKSGTYESDGDLWKYHQAESYRFNIKDFSQIIDILERDGKCELNHEGINEYYFEKHDVLSEDICDKTVRKEAGRIRGSFIFYKDQNLLHVVDIRLIPSKSE